MQKIFFSSPSSLLSVPHLLMVSSSSESQKLVVSSSLLIIVLELSYPARWRSRRLWPFIRGPGTPVQKRRVKIQCEISCLLRSVFTFVTIDHKHSWLLNIPWLYHDQFIVWMLADSQILMAHSVVKDRFHHCCALLFLTVLLQVVSVPRSLSPERNYRLCFSLVIQRFHTACGIGAVKEKHVCVSDKRVGFHIRLCFIHVSLFKNRPLVTHISDSYKM